MAIQIELHQAVPPIVKEDDFLKEWYTERYKLYTNTVQTPPSLDDFINAVKNTQEPDLEEEVLENPSSSSWQFDVKDVSEVLARVLDQEAAEVEEQGTTCPADDMCGPLVFWYQPTQCDGEKVGDLLDVFDIRDMAQLQQVNQENYLQDANRQTPLQGGILLRIPLNAEQLQEKGWTWTKGENILQKKTSSKKCASHMAALIATSQKNDIKMYKETCNKRLRDVRRYLKDPDRPPEDAKRAKTWMEFFTQQQKAIEWIWKEGGFGATTRDGTISKTDMSGVETLYNMFTLLRNYGRGVIIPLMGITSEELLTREEKEKGIMDRVIQATKSTRQWLRDRLETNHCGERCRSIPREETEDVVEVGTMKVKRLREELRKRGLLTKGTKKDLIARLLKYEEDEDYYNDTEDEDYNDTSSSSSSESSSSSSDDDEDSSSEEDDEEDDDNEADNDDDEEED